MKYITKEEFESIGFKYHSKTIGEWYLNDNPIRIDNWYSQGIMFSYEKDINRFYIFAKDCGDEHILFRGIIESFEDFKKLLKQIIYEI